jgi:uncharacterized membrane protein YeaQ/YmgE (transglycosylase-associated protein family)
MGVIAFILLGLIVGAVVKTIWKGHEPGGLLGTLLVGVAGAVLGGLIASAVGLGGLSGFFSVGSWLIAIAGAFLFLFLFDQVTARTADSREPAPG